MNLLLQTFFTFRCLHWARLHRQQTSKSQHSCFITSPTSKLLHFPLSSLARLYRQQTSKTQHSCFVTSLLLQTFFTVRCLHWLGSTANKLQRLSIDASSLLLPQNFFTFRCLDWLGSTANKLQRLSIHASSLLSYFKSSSPSDVFTGSAPPPTNFKDSAFKLHHFSYLKPSSPSDVFTGSAPPPTNFNDSVFMLHHFEVLR